MTQQQPEKEYSIAPEGYFELGARLNPRNNQPYDTTLVSKGFHFELRGSPITSEEDIDYIKRIFSARDPEANCARFILSGPEGGRPVADSHQHGVIQLKSPKRIRFQQILTLPSKKQVMVYAVSLTEYSQATGDIQALIDYIKKHNTEILVDQSNEQLLKQSEQEKVKGRTERIWGEALQQYPFEMALKTLQLLGPRQYSKEVKDFGLQWQKKWNRQVWLDATYKENLKPWKDDGTITEIQDWVKRNSPNKVRGGNLFVVGPSKTGKSEYIIQEVARKYDCFYIKGKFDWTNYDNERNYKFYIFDDVMYDKDSLEAIKALTSGINIPTNINVKYSMAFVKCRPCIHILNNHEYDKFNRMSWQHGGLEWWGKNSRLVEVDFPLFKLDSEVLKEKMELENTMSENSIEFNDDENVITPNENNDDNKQNEETTENEQEEEEEEKDDNDKEEKAPKKFYTKQHKHSFRSRFKHMLRQLDFDEDTVQETMEKYDNRKFELTHKKEGIEYGFDEYDDLEDHPSMQEEQTFENLEELKKQAQEDQQRQEELVKQTRSRHKKKNYEPVYEIENDDYDEDDDLPPSTQYYNTGREAPDGIIYDRFDD